MADEPLIFHCGSSTPQTAGRRDRLPFPTIDMHCHMLVPKVEELTAGTRGRAEETEASLHTFGAESVEVNRAQFTSIGPKLTRLDQRLLDMDAMGVDVQAISVAPTQYSYWADEELARKIVAATNDHLAEACARHPDRLVGLGSVSLQFPELAAEQLHHCIHALGFRGVEISTHVEGMDIADESFDIFWRKADELGAVVFIHPWGTTIGDRLSRHYLGNTVGQPMETAIALSNLIFSGSLDRHPGVKLVAAHGGGYLPSYVGRSDHAHASRPEARRCACKPSSYLKRVWFDSLVYDPAHLARMIDDVGASQIVLGTDYPFDMGHYDPAELLGALSPDIQQAILGGNAAFLLGIETGLERGGET